MALLLGQISFAQEYVHQVLVLNEGKLNYITNEIEVPVTLGSYDPSTQIYTSVDTIEGARFASDMIVDGDYLYVAADNKLMKYDLNTLSVLMTQEVEGIRNLLTAGEYVFATRGEYMIDFDSYLHIYNKSDLSLEMTLDTIDGPKWTTQNMLGHNGKIYIGINNGFQWNNEKSLIGVFDMYTMTYETEIDLGPDATNPDNMMFDGQYLYTVNNKNWSGSSISKVNLSDYTSTTVNISTASTGCGTSCYRDGRLNYQISQDTVLMEWNVDMESSEGVSLGVHHPLYELAYDEINDLLFASSTDFYSYGKVLVFDANNQEVAQFDCSISPGTIVFDVRNATNISDFYVPNMSQSTYNMFGNRVELNESLPQGVYIRDGKKFFVK